jgi:cytochrome b involved in lipid metabolism
MNMKKILLYAFFVVAIAAVIVFSSGSSQPVQPVNSSSGQNASFPSLITSAELSSHNAKIDCWVAYKGSVYDITSWLPVHPGGAGAIAPYCGTSAAFENAFTAQHGTSKAMLLEEVGIYKGELSG